MIEPGPLRGPYAINLFSLSSLGGFAPLRPPFTLILTPLGVTIRGNDLHFQACLKLSP